MRPSLASSPAQSIFKKKKDGQVVRHSKYMKSPFLTPTALLPQCTDDFRK